MSSLEPRSRSRSGAFRSGQVQVRSRSGPGQLQNSKDLTLASTKFWFHTHHPPREDLKKILERESIGDFKQDLFELDIEVGTNLFFESIGEAS